jgi:hypothetical protein
MRTVRGVCRWVALIAALFALRVSAAETLARYAPAETALFVEIPAPEATWRDVQLTELAERWPESRWSAWWLKSPFVERWRALDLYATTKTGETLTNHLRRLCAEGAAIAIVVRERTPAGVFLSRAADADHVTAAVRIWDRLEPPLRTESRTHAGQSYFARVVKKAGREQTVFYAVDGPRFLLTDQESLVHKCLPLWSATKADSLATRPEFGELQLATPPAAWLYVSPPQWLPLLQALSDGTPASQLVLAGFDRLRAVRGIMDLDQGIMTELTATLDSARVTTDWRDFVATAAASPTAIETVPPDALIALGGRLDTARILRGLFQLMPDKDRREAQKLGSALRTVLLGVDPWTVAVPALLSDWTGYIAIRPATEQEPTRSHPFVATWSARWQSSNELAAGLENAVSFGVNGLAAALSMEKQAQPVSLQRHATEQETVWRITGREWGEMAVRQTADEIRFATSATELDRLRDARRNESTPLMKTARDRFPHATAFLWCNTRQVRSTNSSAALRSLLHDREPPPLVALHELSTLFDELFAAVRLEETRITIRAGGRIAAGP